MKRQSTLHLFMQPKRRTSADEGSSNSPPDTDSEIDQPESNTENVSVAEICVPSESGDSLNTQDDIVYYNVSEAPDDPVSSPVSRPTASVSTPVLSRSRRGKHSTEFNELWKDGRPWLLYVEGQGMFCTLCKKHNMRPFDREIWNSAPATRLRLETLKSHESCVAYKKAMSLERESAATANIVQLITHSSPSISAHALGQVFSCLYFLCKSRISTTTVFVPMLDFLTYLGLDLKNKIFGGRNATYCSDKSIQEIIYVISEVLEENLLNQLKASSHYSLMFDETTDISNIEQLVIHTRFINDKGDLKVAFLKILDAMKPFNSDPENATPELQITLNAQNISSRITEFIQCNQLKYSKLRGIGTDGASVMIGKRGGAVKLIVDKQLESQDTEPRKCKAIGVHCSAHKLNLAAIQSAEYVPYVKKVNTILRQLFDFYDNSAVRTAGLHAIQKLLGEPQLKLIEPSSTRWLSTGCAVIRLQTILPSVIMSLDRESEERGDSAAGGLSHMVSEFRFISTMLLLCDVLPRINRLSKVFQTEQIDYSAVGKAVISIVKKLEQDKSVDDKFMSTLPEYIANLESDKYGIQIRYSYMNSRRVAAGSTSDDASSKLNHIACFNETIRKPYLTKLIENIESRFTDSEVLASFEFIFNPDLHHHVQESNLELHVEESTDNNEGGVESTELKTLCNQFGLDFTEVELEWSDFLQYSKDHFNKLTTREVTTELRSNATLNNMFPLICFLSKAYYVIPPHTSDCERDFSQLKLIKTILRNRMSQKTLDAIMRIVLNGPPVEEFDFSEAVRLWAQKKNRRLRV